MYNYRATTSSLDKFAILLTFTARLAGPLLYTRAGLVFSVTGRYACTMIGLRQVPSTSSLVQVPSTSSLDKFHRLFFCPCVGAAAPRSAWPGRHSQRTALCADNIKDRSARTTSSLDKFHRRRWNLSSELVAWKSRFRALCDAEPLLQFC